MIFANTLYDRGDGRCEEGFAPTGQVPGPPSRQGLLACPHPARRGGTVMSRACTFWSSRPGPTAGFSGSFYAAGGRKAAPAASPWSRSACEGGDSLGGGARGTRWDETDMEGQEWTVPAPRMKVHREHRVPLCARAQEILAAAQTLSTGHLWCSQARSAARLWEAYEIVNPARFRTQRFVEATSLLCRRF